MYLQQNTYLWFATQACIKCQFSHELNLMTVWVDLNNSVKKFLTESNANQTATYNYSSVVGQCS